MKAIQKLLDHPSINGNQSKVARLVGKKQGHVWYWVNKEGADIPLELVPTAANGIGEKPSYLRPDIFN